MDAYDEWALQHDSVSIRRRIIWYGSERTAEKFSQYLKQNYPGKWVMYDSIEFEVLDSDDTLTALISRYDDWDLKQQHRVCFQEMD